MAVDTLARMMALDAAQQGGTTDAYTKAETDALLANKPGEITTGKQYTIDGQTVTAAVGAETFNDLANNKASGPYSHAEGYYTTASGPLSHAESNRTTASGQYSHAEGGLTKASGNNSHAEGDSTTASGFASHAEGANTKASAILSHAEGAGTIASGAQSHAEGSSTIASGTNSHAEGGGTKASSENQHVQGKFNVEDANGTYAFIIGNGVSDSSRSNAFSVSWNGSVAEGSGTTASGTASHSEGGGTTASGNNSHAEGGSTTASGNNSHSEGVITTASGMFSHAEGYETTASGDQSHAEGYATRASGASSHAEGRVTKASSANQHVQGRYNVEDANDTYAFIIGNGTADNARHNAFAIDWNGLIYVNGAATGVDVSQLTAVAQAVSGKISATDYATQTTGGTVKAWTTTDGSDTILHLATQ